MYIPGSIIDNKCVTLIIVKYSCKRQEKRKERERETKTEREKDRERKRKKEREGTKERRNEKRERERKSQRKWIERQGAKSLKRGYQYMYIHTYMYVPGSIIDNKCVTLGIAKYSCRKRERDT